MLRLLTVSASLMCCDMSAGPSTVIAAVEGTRAPEHNAVQATSSGYARGRWRLMTDPDLSRTAVFMSHILIAHRDVTANGVSFSVADWRRTDSLPTRSREEAQRLAESLAATLQADPSKFTAYAKEHSDDQATKLLGGSFGSNSALQLSPWGNILDALAALQVGEVSRAVETQYGFHIVLRRAPPAAMELSGARLVIGYDDAPWLRNVARRPIPLRTRGAAYELARALAEQAQRAPQDFASLIDRYSEHRDAHVGGDLGTWSTVAPSEYPREVDVLATLPMRGISEPVDSLVGFEILQRTPVVARKKYAMTAIALLFDQDSPDEAVTSKASMTGVAQQIAAELQRDPARFDALQRQYCCRGVVFFTEGAEYPEVARVLDQMAMGQVGSAPVESGLQLIIPKRLDPDDLTVSPTRFELSFNGLPDASYFLSHMDEETAGLHLEAAASQLIDALHLDLEQATGLREIQKRPWRPGNQTVDQVQANLESIGQALEALLGRDGHALYRVTLQRRLEQYLLGNLPKGVLAAAEQQ
jgi:hypothetical protein